MKFDKTFSEFLVFLCDESNDFFRRYVENDLSVGEFFSTDRLSDRSKHSFRIKVSEDNFKRLNSLLIEKQIKHIKNDKNLDFSIDKDVFRFIISGKKSKTSNSHGKKLADAGELATIYSIKNKIETIDDFRRIIKDETILDVFNDDMIMSWMDTFKYTRNVVLNIIDEPLENFEILHDATDTTIFKTIITSFCKHIKTPKDSWNPSDIFLIRSSNFQRITNELNNIIKTYENNENYDVQRLIKTFNDYLYNEFKNRNLYSFSLKKLNGYPKFEYTNDPKSLFVPKYEFELVKVGSDIESNTKDIGTFYIKNIKTNKNVVFQVRGFPHSYGISQMEITSDGSITGGRVGKVPTKIIDSVLAEYNFQRIKSIKYFGNVKNDVYFSDLNDQKIQELYDMYKYVIEHSPAEKIMLNKSEFIGIFDKCKKQRNNAQNMCHKIQGLHYSYFLLKNKKDLSTIMTKILNGAKKINENNAFFIKIY